MKGIFFQRPLEFQLHVDGETWSQGDAVTGRLTVRNHSSGALPLTGVRVALAQGKSAKVKRRDPAAFTILSESPVDAGQPVGAMQESSFPWSFQLAQNSPITDSLGSPYLVYGPAAPPETIGQLQLPVIAHPVTREFLDVVTTEFRFVRKGDKASKGWVETRLEPPSAAAFSVLEGLSLYSRLEGDRLDLRYVFSVKKIDAAAGMEVQKRKKEFEQSLEASVYRVPSGRFNHASMKASFEDILKTLDLGALA